MSEVNIENQDVLSINSLDDFYILNSLIPCGGYFSFAKKVSDFKFIGNSKAKITLFQSSSFSLVFYTDKDVLREINN